jgi:hypothetical protein
VSSDVRLGSLVPGDGYRDAVHVAVTPCVAGRTMSPGEWVMLKQNNVLIGFPSKVRGRGQGIVDPYLTEPVKEGERFWLCLIPGSVTSLRHQWTHPMFAPEGDSAPKAEVSLKESAEKFLREFAEEVGVSYGVLMESAENWLDGENRKNNGKSRWNDSYHTLNYDTPDVVWEKRKEFWEAYEIVTEKKVADHEATFFSCAC